MINSISLFLTVLVSEFCLHSPWWRRMELLIPLHTWNLWIMQNKGNFSKCHRWGCFHSDKNPGVIEIQLSSQHNQEKHRARGQSMHSRFTCTHTHTHTESCHLGFQHWSRHLKYAVTQTKSLPHGACISFWWGETDNEPTRNALFFLCVQWTGVSGQKWGGVVKETGRPAAGMRPTCPILQSWKISPRRGRTKS